jgi:hypothetical protein
LLPPQSNQHFYFFAQISDDLPSGSGRRISFYFCGFVYVLAARGCLFLTLLS